MTSPAKPRPEFRNIHIFKDVRTYRLPLAARVSILHRASGMLMFVLLPFVLWMLDASLTSEISYGGFTAVFAGAWGWLARLVCLALLWAYLHHFCAGLRHVLMDVNHHVVNKDFGRISAVVVLALSLGLTAVLGAKLFGLY